MSQTEITPVQQMISSCTGAVLTSLTMTPFDVVKVRLQAQQKPFKPGSCFLYSNGLMDCLCVCRMCATANGGGSGKGHSHVQPNGKDHSHVHSNGHHPHSSVANGQLRLKNTAWYERPSHFKGMTDAMIKISRSEGISALWSGLPPTLLMAIPVTVVYFTLYDRLKYMLGYKEHDPATKYRPVAAGLIARTFASSLVSPIELLRVKVQSQSLTYTQLAEAVRFSIRTHGPLYLWHGLGPSLLRDLPFSGIYWFGYELTKAEILQRNQSNELSFLQAFLCGAFSGSVSAVLTLPFDVIKTHQQIQLGEAEISGTSKRYISTSKLVAQLYRESGITALFAGLVPRISKVAPACAIMISTYEFGKQYFRNKNASSKS